MEKDVAEETSNGKSNESVERVRIDVWWHQCEDKIWRACRLESFCRMVPEMYAVAS